MVPLGRKKARHLLVRCNSLTPSNLSQFEDLTIDEALDVLFHNNPPFPTFYTDDGIPWSDQPRANVYDFIAENDTNTGRLFRDMVASFSYYVATGFSTTGIPIPNISSALAWVYHSSWLYTGGFDNNAAIPAYISYFKNLYEQATGNLKDLLKNQIVGEASTVFFGNADSTKEAPSQNLGREIIELWGVGKNPFYNNTPPTHNQQDVDALSALLTGLPLSITSPGNLGTPGFPTVITRPEDHTPGPKVFGLLGFTIDSPDTPTHESMATEINDFINQLFLNPEVPRNYVRKIVSGFAMETVRPGNDTFTSEIEDNIVIPLADQLINDDFQMEPMLRTFFSSEFFFGSEEDDPYATEGVLVGSPQDVFGDVIRALEINLPNMENDTSNAIGVHKNFLVWGLFSPANMDLFESPEVTGYPQQVSPQTRDSYVSAQTILPRQDCFRFIMSPFNGIRSEIPLDVDLQSLIVNHTPSSGVDPDEVIELLTVLASPVEMTTEYKNHLRDDILLDGLSQQNWENELAENNAGLKVFDVCQSLIGGPYQCFGLR